MLSFNALHNNCCYGKTPTKAYVKNAQNANSGK